MWEEEIITSIITSCLAMLVITCGVATAVVALVLKARDRRRLARLNEQYVEWDHNGYHPG